MSTPDNAPNRETPTRAEIRDEIRRLKLIVGHLSKISPAGRAWVQSVLAERDLTSTWKDFRDD